MPVTDQEILASYHRRFARIDHQIPDAPPFLRASQGRRLPRLLAVPVAALAVILVVLGGPLLAGQRSQTVLPSVAPPPSPSPSAATPAPTGPSLLTVAVIVEPKPEPSGIITTGLMPYTHFSARLVAMDGTVVSTWDVTMRQSSQQTVGSGTYRLSIWRYGVAVNVDTGANVTSAPVGECSASITLTPSEPESVVATFPYGGGPCQVTTRGGAHTASP
ncbi:MAG: hypothetical protein ACYDAN_14430 [Candidatus Limnocylindrales bacterium]